MQPDWQVTTEIEAVIFDCDSTLSGIEGISVLAELNGVHQAVHELTEEAMGKTGVSEAMYRDRLALVNPRQQQMQAVVEAYWQALTPDVQAVIEVLQRLGKAVYVASAGLLPPVAAFAQRLGISLDNVFAVPLFFDEAGNYQDFDRACPLIEQNGKSLVVQELRQKHRTIAHIGDGMNDIEAAKAVDRFVGYGGSCYRQSIADLCDFYITSESMAPLLPLLLTLDERAALQLGEQQLQQKGLQLLGEGKVFIAI